MVTILVAFLVSDFNVYFEMLFNQNPIKKIYLTNINGFTLVEIIAALAILGILASISIPKFFNLGSNAKQKVLQSAISGLNSQESMLIHQ